MDLRTKKTLRSINNAFIELRSKKPLCKISVKELCEKAMISKPTFYLHYKDIYDLSDIFEKEIINSIISSTDFLENFPDNFAQKYRNLLDAFFAQGQILNIIFSEDRKSEFSHKLEVAFKEKLITKFPQYKDDIKFMIFVDYTVYGVFHTVILNLDKPLDIMYDTVIQLTEVCVNNAADILKK
ncbi:MAG: TetR/AcrR family transcriptional regulator [Lachnospiraceae bacterium]|nr:TetR/AcrR family transcriptional regulator [Lachnospiraceae bacterium]MDE6253460.1 TetR/AcrR family transcriptional regulator [Lachnospiraceae bacterium]